MKKLQSEEVVIVVTDDEHREELAWGFSEDEVLPVGVHTFHRGEFLKRHGLVPSQMNQPMQVRITLDLDLDIVTFFQKRAEQLRGASYQKQINAALRRVVEQAQ